MNDTPPTFWSLRKWCPPRRLDPDFPMAFWFAGLWLYLKSFFYLCNLYSIGIDQMPFPAPVKIEIAYFALAFVPSLLLGLVLWNERREHLKTAILFLAIDTPLLLFHVWRMSRSGMLDSFLTLVLELGSLGLNFLALGWLVSYAVESKALSRPR